MRLTRFAKVLLCVLVILCLPIAGAVAQDEPDGTWNAPPIGTKAVYNYGAAWEVIHIDGGKVYVKGDRGNETQDTAFYIYRGMMDGLSFDGEVVSIDMAALDKLFPLKVGNKTTLSSYIGDWKFKTTYKVVSHKTVDTVLGKRQVFGIAFFEKGKGHRVKGWGYYDPELGIWHGGSVTFGDGSPFKWKLLHLELPE